jgi:bifunctional non-homologous end joining protein LigD
MVHAHDATRLHYDVRLELDGVLRSWAVPKGPSLDPAERRLAIETPDHELSYAGYEGVIDEGSYGAGPVLVWDAGTWAPDDADPAAALAEGKLTFRLAGEKLRGGWRLVRMREEGERTLWLLIKRRDGEARAGEAAEIVAARPESVKSGRTLDELAAEAS